MVQRRVSVPVSFLWKEGGGDLGGFPKLRKHLSLGANTLTNSISVLVRGHSRHRLPTAYSALSALPLSPRMLRRRITSALSVRPLASIKNPYRTVSHIVPAGKVANRSNSRARESSLGMTVAFLAASQVSKSIGKSIKHHSASHLWPVYLEASILFPQAYPEEYTNATFSH